GEVQVVTRRLVEQAADLCASAGLAAVQQRLQTFTLRGQGAPIDFHDVADAAHIRGAWEGDPAELRDEAPFLRQLAPSSDLLHRCLSRDQARQFLLVAQHDCAGSCGHPARAGGGAPPSEGARPSTAAGARVRTTIVVRTPTVRTYHGTGMPAPCATVDRFGVGDGIRTG